MRITGIDHWLVRLDPEEWFRGREREWTADWLYPLFRIRTDDGVEGYASGFGMFGDGRLLVAGVRDAYGPMVIGADPFRSEELWSRLVKHGRNFYATSDAILGMIDVAIWDIRGKAVGRSIAELLGLARDRVPAYATASRYLDTPEVVFEEAALRKSQGFHGYKLQIWDGPIKDIPRLRAAREAVGYGFPLMLDAAGQYDFGTALRIGRELDRLEYYWFEEPIPDRQMTLLRSLAHSLDTPVMGTETVRLAELGEHVVQNAGDMLRGDVYLKGGVTGLRKALALAELFGMRLEVHTCASPLLDAANLNVACSTLASEFVESFPAMFRFGLVGNPLDVDSAGYIAAPSGPGLGVELDWEWIDEHTVEHGALIG